MTKVIISKAKREEIESILFAGTGALIMVQGMEDGVCTDSVMGLREKFIRQVLDILDNKK